MPTEAGCQEVGERLTMIQRDNRRVCQCGHIRLVHGRGPKWRMCLRNCPCKNFQDGE